jgi:hypothetical protein
MIPSFRNHTWITHYPEELQRLEWVAHCCVDHFGVRIVGIISLQLGFLLSRICMKQGPAFSKKSARLPACLQY